MAWDDMDMWWMDKPDRSNLPELATGAFMQGRAQAQRSAEFNSMLPMKVAESNAQTAAQVAQTDIATKKFERETSEWEKVKNEEPVFSNYSREVANWYSDPLNNTPVPAAPSNLSGERLAQANKLMLDASMAKRVQEGRSALGMAKAIDTEDTAKLIAAGYLDEAKANDFEAKKLARMNRATRDAMTMAQQVGIMNMPQTEVPTLPNGDLDSVALQAQLRKFAPTPSLPSGASEMTVDNRFGGKTTFKADTDKGKSDSELEKSRIEFITKQITAGVTAEEAQRQWDSTMQMKGGAPALGSSQSSPLPYQQGMQMPAAGGWVAIPAGTKIGSEKYETDTVRFFGPREAAKPAATGVKLPSGQEYQFTKETASPKKIEKLAEKVTDLREKLDKAGVSAPSDTTLAIPAGGAGLPPTFQKRPTTVQEKKAYDARILKWSEDLKAAEEELRKAKGE